MKKWLFKGITTFIFLFLIYLLNNTIGSIPALGPLLCPYTGFTQNARLDIQTKDLNISDMPISNTAQILIDTFGIPHIFAQNDSDLYLLQGYMHAFDRLWQMDIQSRSGMGELSEIVGIKALDNDRLMRRLMIPQAAESQLNAIKKDSIFFVISQYCKGVNYYISHLNTKDYPIEFKLIGYKPREYKHLYVTLLLKIMALRLSAMENDVENTNFLNTFGIKEFNALFPNFYTGDAPIIPNGTPYNYVNKTEKFDITQISSKIYSERILKEQDRLLGSNNWAVGKAKSKSGNAILCNDPHLKITLPAIWYEMQLNDPLQNVYGASMPGAPCIIIGFNQNIAWGVTNAGRDVRNWYDLKYNSAKNAIIVDGHEEPLQKHIEKIDVKNQSSFIDTIWTSSFGPIVYDQKYPLGKKNNANMALGWTTYIHSNEVKTFFGLNHGKNLDDYLTSISFFYSPGQNFVYADILGNIAIKQQGLFPNTPPNKDKFILDGSLSQNKMTSFIPMSNNPYIINPSRGFVSSANQHPTDESYPYYYSSSDFEAYRNRRINHLLEDQAKFGMEDMKQIQCDNFSLLASEFLPLFLKNSSQNNKYIKLMSSWNYQFGSNSRAATFFEIWFNQFESMVWDELADSTKTYDIPQSIVLYSLIQKDPSNKFFDIDSTPEVETYTQVLEKSFYRAVHDYESLNDKSWGGYKDTDIAHLGQIPSFGVHHVITGGNKHIVNATWKNWAPSWRMIVEMDKNRPHGFIIYPGGNSGNPASKYYDNFITQWSEYKYRKIELSLSSQEVFPTRTIIFQSR